MGMHLIVKIDSFWIITLLGPYSAVFTTDDGSTYTYSVDGD